MNIEFGMVVIFEFHVNDVILLFLNNSIPMVVIFNGMVTVCNKLSEKTPSDNVVKFAADGIFIFDN